MNTITFHCGDIRDIQATMPASSVDLVVTSPPFLALRSYLPPDHPDKHREIGSEPTPALFLDTMLGLTQEWRRIVTPTGTIAVEIGDTYSGSTADGGDNRGTTRYPAGRSFINGARKTDTGWPLAKSLCGIPTLYTWSLAYGHNLLNPATTFAPWRIRNLLVWTRPNPPVGALGDKFRPATSYVTVACTSDRRWFDLDSVRVPYGEAFIKAAGQPQAYRQERPDDGSVKAPHPAGAPPLDWWDDTEPAVTYVTVACTSDRRWFDLDAVRTEHKRDPLKRPESDLRRYDTGGNRKDDGALAAHLGDPAGAPPLDWWEHDWQPLHNMPTHPYKGAHYATYPVTLPRRLIEAMCPREVCGLCGEPRRRITQQVGEYAEHRARARAVGDDNAAELLSKGLSRVTGRGMERVNAEYTTLGWSDCGHGDYRPGVVLDPFAGSGTTALAAALTGRDAILIDIDPRNVALTRHRIAQEVQILTETSDGPTTVWTVEHQLPGLKGQAEGQLSLFGNG